MAGVRVSRAAQRDLEEVISRLAYLAGLGTAAAFRQAIDELKMLLAAYPEAHALRPNLGPDIRGAVIKAHLVIYRYKWNEVVILRILHGRRDLGPDFRRQS